MTGPPATIALSLVSHTNAGKTTLARTLLQRDVGEVRDAPHTTAEPARYPLVESPDGDLLLLWDTPGFGDSARLARRLAQQGNPVGWFLTEIWDRYRDRTFWLTQQAVRNVRDQADVVLYLVNAGESPADAGYLGPELDVLRWIGKPVLVLLNQMGAPRPIEVEAADVDRWRAALASRAEVAAVLPLDAFARCWVQELSLFAAIAQALPPARGAAFARLAAAWRAQRLAQFDAAMTAIAGALAQAAVDSAVLPPENFVDRLRRSVGAARDADAAPIVASLDALAARLESALVAADNRMIALHGLDGRSAGAALARVAADVATDAPLDERRAAVMGGLVSGALTGLGADLAAGGLTFGAGMLAGALVGALGGAGVARGVNVVRGKSATTVRWQEAFLDRQLTLALLRYLAVAHFGRGRGEFAAGEIPAHWRERAEQRVADAREALAGVWALRSAEGGSAELASRLAPMLREIALALLRDLYPDSQPDGPGGVPA